MIEFFGAGVVIAIVLVGGFAIMMENKKMSATGMLTNQNLNEIKYLGNINNNKFCILNEKNLNKIPVEFRLFFTNHNTAIAKGFKYSEDCN